MIVFYLTQVALDITIGTTWWVVKNTTSILIDGTMYLIRGPKKDEISELRREIQELNKKLDSFQSS
jgi:hypothetical protein